MLLYIASDVPLPTIPWDAAVDLLRKYVAEAAAYSAAEVYACWAGEEALPPLLAGVLQPATAGLDAVSRASELGLLVEFPAATAPVQGLPAQLTPFLGRQEEMAGICGLLSGPPGRLVTIVGPGGTGKTQHAGSRSGAFLAPAPSRI